jgi:hypothetical protein
MKTGGWCGAAQCGASGRSPLRQTAHVLVYVNQNRNLRVVLNFISALLLALPTFNGSVAKNFRVFSNYF